MRDKSWPLSTERERFLWSGVSTSVAEEALFEVGAKGSARGSRMGMKECPECNGPFDFFQLFGMRKIVFMGNEGRMGKDSSTGDKGSSVGKLRV